MLGRCRRSWVDDAAWPRRRMGRPGCGRPMRCPTDSARALPRAVAARWVQGAHSAVPRRLSPVFRDRENAHAATSAHTLQRVELARSQHLIVLCTP